MQKTKELISVTKRVALSPLAALCLFITGCGAMWVTLGSQQVQQNGLLDAVGEASGAYSLRLLRSAYSGNAINVRRSSDNATTDIGFSAGSLNTSALASFCGINTCYVTTWYDQSGNGNDVTQVTVGNQPVIVNAGTISTMNGVPSINFIYASSQYLNIPAAATVLGTVPSTLNMVAEVSGGTPPCWQFAITYGAVGQSRNLGDNCGGSPGFVDLNAGGVSLADPIYVATAPFTATGIFNSGTITLITNGDTPTSSSPGFNTVAAANTIGTGNASYWNGWISEVLLYSFALTQAQVTTVEVSQGNFYGIAVP